LTDPAEHYSRSDVQREIIDFCRSRWVGIHCLNTSGKLIFRRYLRGKPLTIENPEDLLKVLGIRRCRVRSIYATANVYAFVRRIDDVYDFSNIQRCTPTWDIDSNLSNWRETISVAEVIVSYLEEWGLKKSVYIKWSGNGCHIHIHEGALSHSLLEKHGPLSLAYAVVEYVKSKLSEKLMEAHPRGVTIENKMDPTRVFTCPLSLHRELDVVCVCMKPNQLSIFSSEWVNPESFRHNPSWREFSEGEADGLAEAAYRTVGGYPLRWRRRRRKSMPLDKQIAKWLQRE